MPLTPEERAIVARRLRREVTTRFGDNKKDGYVAARVNPATLDNALEGASMKDRSLNAIVKAWWPETQGDWHLIPDLDPRNPRERYSEQVATWDDLDEKTRTKIQRLLGA